MAGMAKNNKIMNEDLKIPKIGGAGYRTLSKFHLPDYKLMYQLLKDMKRIFGFHDIKWCCCFGTLLGAVRDGDFAGMMVDGVFKKHDYDMDIAIFGEDIPKFQKAFDDFLKLGYSVSHLNMAPAVIFKENEWMDLWLFGKAKNKDYVGCMGYLFHKRFFENLKTAKIKDIEVNVPNFAEEFVELIYGSDWKTPNPKGSPKFLCKSFLPELEERMKQGI